MKICILKSLVQDNAEVRILADNNNRENNATFNITLEELAKHFFPKSPTAEQKRAMCYAL